MSALPLAANQERFFAAADLLKKLSHPSRLMILARLADGEAAVAELESGLGLRQPALSQQLAELRHAAIVETRRSPSGVVYRLNDARAAEIVRIVRGVFLISPSSATAQARSPSAGATVHSLFGAAMFAKVSHPSDPSGDR